ncbi:F510_1955 family glycosylhydrolase [Halobacillus salinus]|uniref:F510_1955 family glycosylhydrolase n=1 Tax=Halobacillus salinus TaxID=192814 RepID=UPI0009A84857|nr:hypothetical protein [Halobacillus salinus]
MKARLITSLALASVITIAGCSQANQKESSQQDRKQQGSSDVSLQEVTETFDGTLQHVHGMGYLDENSIAFAAHSGIKIYKDGEWLSSTYHQNDYMGFNVVEDGFYTSGHPGEQSDLPNPIGIQRGEVIKEDLTSLAFKGESDFHAMGVGARNEAIYVLNQRSNSEMGQGLYKSTDDGENWQEIAAENLGEKIFQIAVHPDDENLVAVAGATGIFLSEDGGEKFERISNQGQGSGLYFSDDKLYYGLYTGKPSMIEYNWEDQAKKELSLPELTEDAVMYISKHPTKDGEYAIFTIKGSSYVTEDSGGSWEQILDHGQTK